MNKNTHQHLPTDTILRDIRKRFYASDPPEQFHRDRRMLLYAITWPAGWLEQRALRIAPGRYQDLLTQRLDAIATHGNPDLYRRYFPRYLLKSIQDWFAWHGEDLYDELKHIRNALPDIATLLQNTPPQNPPDVVEPLARAHHVLHVQYRRKKQPAPQQLELF